MAADGKRIEKATELAITLGCGICDRRLIHDGKTRGEVVVVEIDGLYRAHCAACWDKAFPGDSAQWIT